jgi:hypothetical protein
MYRHRYRYWNRYKYKKYLNRGKRSKLERTSRLGSLYPLPQISMSRRRTSSVLCRVAMFGGMVSSTSRVLQKRIKIRNSSEEEIAVNVMWGVGRRTCRDGRLR